MTNRMMKILLLLTFVLMTGAASAQQRTTYDARGRVVSRESTSGNTTTVYVIADATSAGAVSRNY
jgi:YD repeat-containing protein